MRKLFTSVLLALMPLLLMAQGWPANYGGVMLQSFVWDSYDATKWTALTANSDELSQCFDLIWVPQSGFIPGDPASTPAKSMGYNDVYWLKQDSYFGTETELRNMISTFKSKGTGIIADVVVNHKNGASNWTDFPNESKNGYTLTWNPLENICNTDEFTEIRENPYKFSSVEELRTACFAARGRIAQPKAKQNFSARMPIEDSSSANDNGGRYGDLFDRFGHRK